MDKKLIFILFWFFSLPIFGQEIKPQGHFHKDSVKIGEELPYSLWVRYAKDKDVVFPDSLYDFSPFELDKRVYFTTKSDSLESLDSVIYYFSTFEIDTVQYLTLPIYFINEYDSTTSYASTDSIILDQVVTTLPDSVAVLTNTNYQKVPLAFNYPYFTVGVIAFIILALVIFIAFGKRIRKSIKIFRLTRHHKRFITSFDKLLAKSPLEVEKSLSAWKKYQEKLANHPYTKFTSKEIISLTHESSLADQLSVIDQHIYGGNKNTDTRTAFRFLLTFSVNQFQNKIKEIKNG